MKILTVIPARSGSRRLPGKNLRTVGGVSLVRRAVEQALAVKRDYWPEMHVVLVSGGEPLEETERIEIEGKQADRVLRRYAEEAHGLPTGVNGWGDGEHAAGFAIEQCGGPREWDAVMLLQPTSPLRTTRSVANALGARASMDRYTPATRSVISCCTPGVPNGAIYIANAQRFHGARSWGYATAFWYEMDVTESLDVDCEHDLTIANGAV